MATISKILELYYTLTLNEQSDLLIILNNQSYGSDIPILKPDNCPHCNGSNIVSNGSSKGRSRYRCKACKRSFGELSDTNFSNIKKLEKFKLFKNIMFTEGIIPLQTMCQRVGISIQTSFDWRHRLTNSLTNEDVKFDTETQLDDLNFNYSQKGRKGLKYSKERGGSKKAGDNNFQVKILAATDKSQTVMKVAKIGRISKVDIEHNLGKHFESNVKLVSDAHPSIIGFAKENNLKHVSFKSKNHIAKTGENVQYLNRQAEALKTLVNRNCKGVSTKYLQNYANWFSFMETNKEKNTNALATKALLEDTKGWDNFTNAENNYKKFIQECSQRTYRCPVTRFWKSNNWNTANFAT